MNMEITLRTPLDFAIRNEIPSYQEKYDVQSQTRFKTTEQISAADGTKYGTPPSGPGYPSDMQEHD